jgi:hypothetical protein
MTWLNFWNTRITDDQGYIPVVVVTIRFIFPHSNLVISHEWRKDREVPTTGGRYPWKYQMVFKALNRKQTIQRPKGLNIEDQEGPINDLEFFQFPWWYLIRRGNGADLYIFVTTFLITVSYCMIVLLYKHLLYVA